MTHTPAAKVLNCTPHTITVGGVTIPPSGVIPRVEEWVEQIGTIAAEGVEIPLTRTRLGEVVGLPDPKPGTWLVVSRMTAEAAPDREDLLIPGKQIRDDQERICGAESLSRLLYTRVDEVSCIADHLVSTRVDAGYGDADADEMARCVEDLRARFFLSQEEATAVIRSAFRRFTAGMVEFYAEQYDISLRVDKRGEIGS